MDDERIEAELRGYGISVEHVATGDPVEVTYMTAFPGDHVNHREMGQALNAFIDLAESGAWTPTDVEATVVRFEDDVLGTWRADAAWFRDLLDDQLTQTEFSTRVLDTLDEPAAPAEESR